MAAQRLNHRISDDPSSYTRVDSVSRMLALIDGVREEVTQRDSLDVERLQTTSVGADSSMSLARGKKSAVDGLYSGLSFFPRLRDEPGFENVVIKHENMDGSEKQNKLAIALHEVQSVQ